MTDSSNLLRTSIRWMKQNLFDDWLMGLVSLFLTVCLLCILYWIVQWAIINAVWSSDNWETCKATIATLHGKGARGACWGVFSGRSGSFIFGLDFPKELYWRPTVALLLLPFAILPIFIQGLPRKTFILSAIYPILAWILIWGGFGLQEVPESHVGGFLLTIIVTLEAALLAVFFGFLLAFGRRYSIFPLRLLCKVVLVVLNGIPTLIWLFVGLSIIHYFLPQGTYVDQMVRAVIFLGLPAAAKIAYSVSSCIIHADKDQWEAASSLGFHKSAAFWLIILPQTFRFSTPQILQISAGICRHSALLSLLGMLGPITFARASLFSEEWHQAFLELFTVTAICYWLIIFTMTSCADRYSRKIISIQGN